MTVIELDHRPPTTQLQHLAQRLPAGSEIRLPADPDGTQVGWVVSAQRTVEAVYFAFAAPTAHDGWMAG